MANNKTTVRISRQMHMQLKVAAAKQQVPIELMVDRLLRAGLAAQRKGAA